MCKCLWASGYAGSTAGTQIYPDPSQPCWGWGLGQQLTPGSSYFRRMMLWHCLSSARTRHRWGPHSSFLTPWSKYETCTSKLKKPANRPNHETAGDSLISDVKEHSESGWESEPVRPPVYTGSTGKGTPMKDAHIQGGRFPLPGQRGEKQTLVLVFRAKTLT